MGGFGSGGWNRSARRTTHELKRLDVNQLRRAGALSDGARATSRWERDGETIAEVGLEGRRSNVEISFAYKVDGENWRSVRQSVPLEWRACRFGGERPYFRCPDCSRPAIHLYLWLPRFRCRDCASLTYQSRREAEHDRAMRRANRIRTRLGGEPGWTAPMPPRPRFMHRKTYDRMIEQIIDYEERVNDYAAWLLTRLEAVPQSRKASKSEYWA